MVERKMEWLHSEMEVGNPYDIISVVGPTASGKTRLAVEIARILGGEIISGDSRQVYRKMDIGTGKDIEEYGDVGYHLIDIVEAGHKYNLHQYLRDFSVAYDSIKEKGKTPVLCGGSGLYIETVLSGIKLPEVPENRELRRELENRSLEELTEILRSKKTLHNTTDIDTVKRAVRAIEIEVYYEKHPDLAKTTRKDIAKPLKSLTLGLDISRDERRKRISERLDRRLKSGMVEEVENLLKQGISPEDLIYYGLEYKYITLYLIGRLSFEEMKRQLEIAIHQFGKRQMTWFRGMEKRGYAIKWIPYDITSDELKEVLRNSFLKIC